MTTTPASTRTRANVTVGSGRAVHSATVYVNDAGKITGGFTDCGSEGRRPGASRLHTVVNAVTCKRCAAVDEVVAAPEVAEVEELPADLGRMYPSADGSGFVALPATHSCETCPSIGSTLCDDDGVSIVYPTRGDAARAILAHLRATDADDEAALLVEHRRQEQDTARIEQLCADAEEAHNFAMNTIGRGKGRAFEERNEALDKLREAALPAEATNADALLLALGGTTVEAIEHRYTALRGERLAEKLTDGTLVRFAPGAMPSCEGVTFAVEGTIHRDNTRGGRPFVWLRADDESGRHAYVDALVLA